MKLIKYSLMAAVGVFLLPAPPPDSFTVMQGGTKINLETGEVLGAAASAYGDVTGFCQRQPSVCITAGQAFSVLEVRAKYNFQRLYEWSQSSARTSLPGLHAPAPSLNFSIQPQAQIKASPFVPFDPIMTGSIKSTEGNTLATTMLAEAIERPSVNTLQIQDLLPEWRGPVRTSTG